MSGSAWPEEMIDRLKSLVAKGLSYSDIGRILGISRNAAIGKAKRLGISNGRDAVGGPQFALQQWGKPARAKPEQPPECVATIPVDEPPSLNILLFNAGHRQCRWIVCEPDYDAVVCGHETNLGQPYCDHHRSRCWQQQTTKRESVRKAGAG